jgi:hypothetical protein
MATEIKKPRAVRIYLTYAGWKAGIKREFNSIMLPLIGKTIGDCEFETHGCAIRFYGDKDIAGAMLTMDGKDFCPLGEWDGSAGEVIVDPIDNRLDTTQPGQ